MSEKLEKNNEETKAVSKIINNLYANFEKEHLNKFFQEKLDIMHKFCNIDFEKLNNSYDESIKRIYKLEQEKKIEKKRLEDELVALKKELAGLKTDFNFNNVQINSTFEETKKDLSDKYEETKIQINNSLCTREKELEDYIVNKKDSEIKEIEMFKNKLDLELAVTNNQIDLVCEIMKENIK